MFLRGVWYWVAGCSGCRFLPDKAIDLVDEAAAKLKMEITSKPEALDEIDRKVLQLEMERLSLQKVSWRWFESEMGKTL